MQANWIGEKSVASSTTIWLRWIDKTETVTAKAERAGATYKWFMGRRVVAP